MDAKATGESVGHEVVEGVVAIGLWELLTKLGKLLWNNYIGPKTKEIAGQKIDEALQKITENPRGKLLALFATMPAEDVANLKRRHKAAWDGKAGISENKFAMLLLEIPETDRKDALKWLNGLTDDDFWQMMYLLEHDPIHQWWQRVGKSTAQWDERAAAAIEKHRREIEKAWWAEPGRLPVIGFFIDPFGWYKHHRERRREDDEKPEPLQPFFRRRNL